MQKCTVAFKSFTLNYITVSNLLRVKCKEFEKCIGYLNNVVCSIRSRAQHLASRGRCLRRKCSSLSRISAHSRWTRGKTLGAAREIRKIEFGFNKMVM